jgi:hypothetical protein
MDQAWAQERGTARSNTSPAGQVRFAPLLERDSTCRELEELDWVVVILEGIGPSSRGHLKEMIHCAIERELEVRGANGSIEDRTSVTGRLDRRDSTRHLHAAIGEAAGSDASEALREQLSRAQAAGAQGIAVVLGPLRAAAGPSGALDPADCAVLRTLASEARAAEIALILDGRDADTMGYGEPTALRHLINGSEPFPEQRPTDPEPLRSPGPSLPSRSLSDRPGASADRSSGIANEPSDAVALDADTLPPSAPASPVLAEPGVLAHEEPWRAWALQLTAARGPQPLAALERLFGQSYLPLSNAIAAGLDDPRARAAHDEFRATFTRGYTDAFATFAATTKRPRMVLDVHDIAGRIARLHGARSTRLLLVDGMRWDIGRLIEERLSVKLGARAALTDELVLWSALPTTTMRQLETIARGIEALRAPGEIDQDSDVPRGRTAEYIRRMRVGARELHKLDIVESRLRHSRGDALAALPDIADGAAEIIAHHAETLAPHTLLFVFGDHGFRIDRTGTAQQGGASPEEVLVGAFALLVGDTH